MKIGDSRINEAEERISGDRVVAIRAMEKNTEKKERKKERKKINKYCLRDFWDNDKHANNYALVVPEAEEREKRPKKIL